MKSIEIKKAIIRAIKYVKNYSIELVLYHGDGTIEGQYVIYNCLTVWNDDSREDYIFGLTYSKQGNENIEEDLKRVRLDQKKMYTYLKKHFKNISILESNV